MSDLELHQTFLENLDKVFYSYWYYLAIVVNFSAMFKLIIKEIIKTKILKVSELIFILSWGYLIITNPIVNGALAAIFGLVWFVEFFILIENIKIFDFNKRRK